MLIEMGYDAYAVAISGDEALTRAAEHAPDLALMDINIRGPMNGVETAALLRRRFGTAIVYLTAFAYDSIANRLQQSEPHAYLVKPVTSAALKSTIELSLYRHDLERRLRNREQELSRNNVFMSTMIEHIQTGVLVEDEGRRIQYANRLYCSAFGAAGNPRDLKDTDGMALTQRIKELFADPERFVAGIDRLLHSRKPVSNELLALADGRVFERDYVPMFSDGIYRGQLWSYRDVSERELARGVLEESSLRNRRISMNDELTALHNRRGFHLAAEQYLKTAWRADRQTVLFFLDINGLKTINDTLGHSVGDQALCDVADILKNTFRDSDILGRLGGDEFVVLASMHLGHEALTSRLRERMAQFNANGGRPYRLDASIGAVVHTAGETLDEILIRADTAMYLEKRSGKVASG